MKLHVSLYGILSRDVPGYSHEKGIDVKIADGATAGELLAHLEIPHHRGAVVFVNGRILKKHAEIAAESHVKIFQTVHGG